MVNYFNPYMTFHTFEMTIRGLHSVTTNHHISMKLVDFNGSSSPFTFIYYPTLSFVKLLFSSFIHILYVLPFLSPSMLYSNHCCNVNKCWTLNCLFRNIKSIKEMFERIWILSLSSVLEGEQLSRWFFIYRETN